MDRELRGEDFKIPGDEDGIFVQEQERLKHWACRSKGRWRSSYFGTSVLCK